MGGSAWVRGCRLRRLDSTALRAGGNTLGAGRPGLRRLRGVGNRSGGSARRSAAAEGSSGCDSPLTATPEAIPTGGAPEDRTGKVPAIGSALRTGMLLWGQSRGTDGEVDALAEIPPSVRTETQRCARGWAVRGACLHVAPGPRERSQSRPQADPVRG